MTKRFGRRLALVLATATACALAVAGPAAATGSSGSRPVLLGFGDSVTAGYGLGPISSSPFSEPCARSDASYVNLAAGELGYGFANYACSGAVTTNIFLTPQSSGGVTVPVQLRQAAAGPRPTVTVTTIGANDVHWSTFLAECLQHAGCDSDANTATFKVYLAKAKVGLVASVVGEELLHPRRVILAAYYDPFEGDPAAFGLTAPETAWYQARLADVNNAIQATARLFPNATYLPVSLDPTSPSDPQLVQGPTDPGPFHPTAAGQQVIANEHVAVLRSRG